MRIFTATFVLLYLGFAHRCWAAPSALSLPQQPFTEEQAASLLRADNHLPDVARVAFYENWEQKPQDIADVLDTYKAQKAAIEAVGARKWVNLIPLLIPYLDYPAEGAMQKTPPAGETAEGIVFETSRLWPAFKAIYSFGPQAVAPLTTVIHNPDGEMRLRITALQVLYAIDKTQAQIEGKELAQSALEAKQRPLAELVNQVTDGQKRFWGIVDFQPITMSVEEVAEWLTTDRHLDPRDLRTARRWPIFPLPDDPQSKKDAARVLSEVFRRQKESMRNAGDLKLVALVPSLLVYMDYPANGTAYIASAGSFTLRSRRQNWPALDAILKMGPDAIVPVQNVLADKSQTFELRQMALSVLHDLAPEQAVNPGQLLLEEAKQAGDEKSQNTIEFILERSDNTSLLTILKRGMPKGE